MLLAVQQDSSPRIGVRIRECLYQSCEPRRGIGHFAIMVSESIQWAGKENMLYNVDTGKVEALKFLRLNKIDKCNNGMGDVDVADQLRGVYSLDHWVRNRKWW